MCHWRFLSGKAGTAGKHKPEDLPGPRQHGVLPFEPICEDSCGAVVYCDNLYHPRWKARFFYEEKGGERR